MGLIKDLQNYHYVRNCFRLIVKNDMIKRRYNPKISSLGILYLWHKVPENTPDDYIDELVLGYLLPLDEALQVMNTDGIIKLDYTRRAVDDRFYYYLVKIVPIFQTISFWYFIKLGVVGLIIWYIINKFELWQHKDMLISWLEDFWINIKPK